MHLLLVSLLNTLLQKKILSHLVKIFSGLNPVKVVPRRMVSRTNKNQNPHKKLPTNLNLPTNKSKRLPHHHLPRKKTFVPRTLLVFKVERARKN